MPCFAPDTSFMLEVTYFLGEGADVPAVSMGPAVTISASPFSMELLLA